MKSPKTNGPRLKALRKSSEHYRTRKARKTVAKEDLAP